jgi:citrate synthase
MIVLNGEEYLTGEEAAEILGVKRATLYAYVSRGVLRSYRQGIKRQRLYRRADLEALVQLSPGAEVGSPGQPGAARGAERQAPDRRDGPQRRAADAIVWSIPLAESWIRD